MPEQNGLLPLVVDDFSGGLSDHFFGADISKSEKLENQIILDNKDLDTRPGALVKYPARINSDFVLQDIIDHNGDILMRSGDIIQYYSGGVSTVRCPNNHKMFVGADDNAKTSFAYWNGHTIGASDSFTAIQKIYKNEDGDWRGENLGLPSLRLFGSIALANDLKTKFNSHIADTGQHSAADTTNTISAADAEDLPSLLTLTNALLDSYKAHEADAAKTSGWSWHIAKEASSHALSDYSHIHGLFSAFTILKELKTKFNAHDADDTAHTVGSSHQSDIYAEPQASGTTGTSNYLYGLHYQRKYFVENKQFLEKGPVLLVEIDDISSPDTDSVTITDIPELTDGTKDNWQDDSITISIFRTLADGSTLFYVDEIDNGTTSYTDSASDDTIKNNETAYTEGGILDNDAPPPAKYCDIVDGRLVVANVKIGDVVYEERLMMGNNANISSMPSSFYIDFESGIKGIGHVGTLPIAFLKNKLYRVEGSFNSDGSGGLKKYSISQRVGLTSAKSIVQTDSGIFFAAEDGIYFTDGYKVQLVSTDREVSYRALSNKDNIRGAFHKLKNWILFAVQEDEDSNSNDTIWCGHGNLRTPEQGIPFTTWSGGLDADNFTASALNYIDGAFYRADYRGYLLYHDEDTKTDPFVDTTALTTAWYTQTIFFDIRSVAFDFDNAQVRKWVPKINLNCDNVSSLNLLIESNNDNSGLFNKLKPIQQNGNVAWGDRTVLWGNENVLWNYSPVISEWRYFPANNEAGIRCMYKQVKFSNNYIPIDSSASIGTVGVDASAKTVTLDDTDASWVDDPVNYYISFSDDDYALEFKIVGVSSGVITVSDNNSKLTDKTGADWKIKGYKKGESLRLFNYVLSYRPLTMSQKTYEKTGEAS